MLKYADILKQSVTMELIPMEVNSRAKNDDAYSHRYDTFDTLSDYYSKNPEKGLTADDSAERMLAYQLALKMDRLGKGKALPNMKGSGRFSVTIPKHGRGLPLLKRLDDYADIFRSSYVDNIFEGGPREMYFDSKGRPLMISSLADSRYLIANGLRDIPEAQGRLGKALYDKLANEAAIILRMSK